MKTTNNNCCNSFYFYIKPQRIGSTVADNLRCNSFYFYIKPQRAVPGNDPGSVVIHSISTSNHNEPCRVTIPGQL